MNFLRFILIIGIFFKEHVGSVELQWDVPQNRKLLIAGGVADAASKDKVAFVSSGGKTYTGVQLSGVVVIPAQLAEPLVVKKGDGTTEVKAILKIHDGNTFLREVALTDLDAGTEPAAGAACKVLGVNSADNLAASVDCTVSKVEEKTFTCTTTASLCASDIGAGVMCADKLAGILKIKAEGGGDAAAADGASEAPTEAPAARRRRDDEPAASTEADAAGGAAAVAGVDCGTAYEAINIIELQRMITAEGGGSFATNIRPTYIIAFIPAVILLSFLFVH